MLAFTDEVLDSTRVSGHIFAQAQEEFSSREVELLLTIGYFRMMSGLLTRIDIDLDAPCAVELLELASEVA